MPAYIEVNSQNVITGAWYKSGKIDNYANNPQKILITDDQYQEVTNAFGANQLKQYVDGVVSDALVQTAPDPVLRDIIRIDRNALLAESDWTQAPDSPLSEEQKQLWRSYRQALRDLPATTTDPSNPVWPAKP